LIEGKPALRIVARLAGILEDEIESPASRDNFWASAASKLGRLRRLSQRDTVSIERQLVKRVPRPAPTHRVFVCPSANPITGPHHPWRRPL
jgi:hypothetical protein